MKYNYILAMDPSGAFDEGKGTTGYCLLDHNKNIALHGCIEAKNFYSAEDYWDAHLTLIDTTMNLYDCILVIEDYILYKNKAESQTNSRMETSRLLGIIQLHCYKKRYPIYWQLAGEVKNRWEDHIVKRQLTLPTVNRHEMDSIRHALHYFTFRNDLNKKHTKPKKYPAVFTNVKEEPNE